jgi:FtsH-binding integral membrane protein
MLRISVKTFLSKSVFANPVLKSPLLNAKAPLQTAFIQRSFARNPKSHRYPSNTSHEIQETYQPNDVATPTGPPVDKIIREDTNLNKFMSKIYRTTGLSIAGSLSLSYLLATSSVAIASSPSLAIFGGLACTIGGIVAMNRIPPEIVLEKIGTDKMVEKWKNPLSRQIAFSSIIAGSGIMVTPLIQFLLATNPGIIPMAAGLSLLTMGGASLYAMAKPLGQFKTWESTLYSSLIGLVGMNIMSLLLFATIGPNVFSLACGKIDMYIGLGLFTAFQAYDTHVAVQAFKEGNYDHLMHVVNFFLNFKNIFIRIAEILSLVSGSND